MDTRPRPDPDATSARAAAASGHPFLSPPEASDELGRLGAYRVLAELGRGGMGVVYLAEEIDLKRRVALKVMLPEAAANPRAVARFRREAEAQAAVEHDHVTSIYHVGQANGVPFIIMPLLKGQTLGAALAQNPRPPLGEVLRIAREIAEGLSAAHAVGLIHRDIKPGNVWLEAPKWRVKILDFGLARVAHDPGGSSPDGELTATGAITGTPFYMAPEQARGLPVDHRTDLFSLGVVLYQMCAGKRPFGGGSAFDVMAAVVSQPARPVRELNPDLPEPLADLIHRLLAKEPGGRPASAEAVAAELDAIARAPSSPTVRIVPGGADPWEDIDTVADTEYEDAAPAVPAPPAGAAKWLWPAVGLAGLVAAVAVGLAVLVGTRPKPKPDVADAPRPQPVSAALPKVPAAAPKPAPDADRKAVEWVRSVGGKALVRVDGEELGWDYDLKDLPAVGVEVVRVNLDGRTFAPDELKALTGLRHVVEIDLNRSKVTDAGLAHLRDLPDLRVLRVCVTAVTDAGCAHIAKLAAIRELHISVTALTDAGLEVLTALPDLSGLDLNLTKVTDAGMPHLLKMKRLRGVGLHGTKVTDAGFARLAEIPDLDHCDLSSTSVTDTGLLAVATAPHLRSVHAPNTTITAGGAGRFARAAPMAKLVWDGPTIMPAFPDRKATEYVLSVGGRVTIRRLGKKFELGPGVLMVPGSVELVGANLEGNQKLTAAGLSAFRGCAHLETLDLHGASVTDAGLAHFRDCTKLTHLGLDSTQVTDAGLAAFRDCVALRVLDLRSTSVTDAGLAYFKDCTALEVLLLGRTRLSDAGLVYFKRLKGLKRLDLGATQVGDVGLSRFENLAELTTLVLHETRVTDAGLAVFRNCTNLTHLHLQDNQVGDVGVAHFRNCKKLVVLQINGSRVSDAALGHFKDCNSLEVIYLRNTGVTPGGTDDFARALPLCRIEWNGGVIGPKKP